jgi:hypothetical protein
VANKPAAMPPTHETDGLGWATAPVPATRIGVPILLLKTILPRPTAATGAPTGRIYFSIAGWESWRNERNRLLVIGQLPADEAVLKERIFSRGPRLGLFQRQFGAKLSAL